MTESEKGKKADTPRHDEAEDQARKRRPIALWLGGGKRDLEMGGGRGPRTLKAHELVSWFFSRDGV